MFFSLKNNITNSFRGDTAFLCREQTFYLQKLKSYNKHGRPYLFHNINQTNGLNPLPTQLGREVEMFKTEAWMLCELV